MNKDTENIKRNQNKILELSSTLTKWKNLLERFKGRLEQAKETINSFEDRTRKFSCLINRKENNC